jgi:multidrug efflux system membrane fusion protein
MTRGPWASATASLSKAASAAEQQLRQFQQLPLGRRLSIGAAALLGLALLKGLWPQGEGQKPRPPVPVQLSTARLGALNLTYPLTGEVKALASAAIQPEVSGILQRIYFREGQQVTAGAPLLGIDPAPFQAELQQASALVREAQANLRRSQTQARTARLRAQRYSRLGLQGAVSRDQEEQFRSDAEALEAGVNSAESQVLSARAKERVARLKLQRTVIRSPITGRAGQLRVSLGNLVRDGQGPPLMVVNQFSPIDVQFAVPQRLLPQLQTGQAVVLEDRARGQVVSIDNAVDPSTGTTAVKARFANPQQRLVPGQFVKGTLALRRLQQVLLVPQTAVQTGQRGSFVYLMEPNRRVKAQPVQLGDRSDGQVVVRQGLRAGDQVVSRGQFALRPGASVLIKP